MTGKLTKREFLIALAEGKAVKIDNDTYYRLKDNKIQMNSPYSSGNWHEPNTVTPLLLDSGIAIEEPQEHYYPLDIHNALDVLLHGGMVNDKEGNAYVIDSFGDLVRFPGYERVSLMKLRGKRFYRNEDRTIELCKEAKE